MWEMGRGKTTESCVWDVQSTFRLRRLPRFPFLYVHLFSSRGSRGGVVQGDVGVGARLEVDGGTGAEVRVYGEVGVACLGAPEQTGEGCV